MRWEELFRDLEAQVEAAERAELLAEVADRTRLERSRSRLVDRLRAGVGQPVVVQAEGVGTVGGTLTGVGSEWLLVEDGQRRQVLVPMQHLVGVSALSAASAVPGSEGAVAARLGLAHALRGLARDRCGVQVVCRDGSVRSGTLDRVGADFAELAEHAPGEARRRGEVRNVRAIPFPAIAAVRSS
jgi:hypothetical protein